MMTTCTPFLKTLAFAALVCHPLAAAAQSPRSTGVAPPPPRTVSAPAARGATAITSTPGWTDQEYRLGAGDKLRVEVYGQSQLSQSLQIRPDGKITLPLVGDVQANGRTSNELRDSIAVSLKEYVNNPVVTVIVQEAVSAQVYIVGEVTNPGTQVLSGPTTVLQALAQAGGFKEFANKSNVGILRKTTTGTQTIEYDYKKAVKGRIQPLFLQPGDTVVVR
jgi:polysaccharide export outer membrane protein